MQVFPHKHPQNPHKDTIILLSFLLFPPERSPDETGERPCPIRLRGRIPLPLFLLRCSLRSRLCLCSAKFLYRMGSAYRLHRRTCYTKKEPPRRISEVLKVAATYSPLPQGSPQILIWGERRKRNHYICYVVT